MGFFSDLKEDLSQAVNELMPMGEEHVEDEPTDLEPETVEAESEGESTAESLSLEEMLANIDDVELLEQEAGENPEEVVENASEETSEEISMEELLAEALASIPDGGDGKPEEDQAEESSSEELQLEEPTAEQVEDSMVASIAEAVVLNTAEANEDVAEEAEAEDSLAEELAAVAWTVEEPEHVAGKEAETETDADKTAADTETEEENNVQEDTPAEREESKGARQTMDSYANRQAMDETAVITKGTQICGDLMSEGSLDVIGTVEGNIDILGKLNIIGHINGNSKAAEIYAEGAKINGEVVSEGSVKIGEGSVIIGNITAKSAAIAGAVKGDIDVQGPVILDSSAIVMGDIKSKSVQINNGAVIEGMCSQCYADVSPTRFFDDYKPEIRVSKKKAAAAKEKDAKEKDA